MYTRLLQPPKRSFFLLGPRGTGKTAWLRATFAEALRFDLLDGAVFAELIGAPQRLADRIPKSFKGWVAIDEVQRIPELLNEVHRLIEERKLRFALTGSSARKLRRGGVNLLAGRASMRHMHPFAARELGADFSLDRALTYGCLPLVSAIPSSEAGDALKSYVSTYLREEVQQEGLVRNLGAFGRFLEAASFSQASVLNMASVARETGVTAKVVGDFFQILEDLLIAIKVPVFSRRAKRKLVSHPKFFFFDVGVYRALRPRGPLDDAQELGGIAFETLVLQQIRAVNDALELGYGVHFWRSAKGDEVDFVLYGDRGLHAVEVKSSTKVRSEDLRGIRLFLEDYPMARAALVYGGTRRYYDSEIEVIPALDFFEELPERLNKS